MSIYLDYAAATPVDPAVLAAMQPYYAEYFYNPSALYLSARDCRLKLDDFRARCAAVLGANKNEIIFTGSATEANNLAINGAMEAYGGEMLMSGIEHDSIVKAAAKWPVKPLEVDNKGRLDLNGLKKAITEETTLISIIYVSNELGVVQSLKTIAEIVHEVKRERADNGNKRPLILHSDASQAQYLDMHVSRLGVDMMTVSGGKMYGPKQSACLYIRAGIDLMPQVNGGGQEMGLRSGTESLGQIVGFTMALELANKRAGAENKRLSVLRNEFIKKLEALGGEVLGHLKYNSPHIVSVRLPGVDNERLVMELDEAGIQAASGSACKAMSGEPSSVLRAIGLSDAEAGEVVRFSFGKSTDKAHLAQTIRALQDLLN